MSGWVSSTTRSSPAESCLSTRSASACITAPRTPSSRLRISASARSSPAWRSVTTLRQLARLTRRVPAAGPRALAFSVYADGDDRSMSANDKGYEGIACVDDVARGVVLFLDLWQETSDPRLRAWASGMLDFVLYMQRDDGRFHNFIQDWDGTINEHGPTSFAGGEFWHDRAAERARAHHAGHRGGIPRANRAAVRDRGGRVCDGPAPHRDRRERLRAMARTRPGLVRWPQHRGPTGL